MEEKFKNLLIYFTPNEINTILKMDNLYLKACLVVRVLFKDKVDKAGKPYTGHLYRVANRLEDSKEKVAAILHDTLEDTDVTYNDLINLGFTGEILDIVKLVTHEKFDKTNMTEEEILKLYNNEIDKVINSGNIHAIRLKEADMSDNYNPSRLSELSEDKREWFNKKYGPQLIKLRKVKGEIK